MNRLPMFAVILSGLFIGTAAAAAADSRRPNILFILADDPAHAEKRRELEALLLAEMQRLHDPHRFSDQPTVEAVR